jgi:hypothetical protein
VKEEAGIKSWKKAQNLNHVFTLCDRSVLMRWNDAPRLTKQFTHPEQMEIISYFVKTLSDHIEDRLFCEIMVENMLIWMSHHLNEELAQVFIKEIFSHPIYGRTIRNFVEIAITTEMTAYHHAETMVATAVSLICEIGKHIIDEGHNTKHNPHSQDLLAHITTYLLSVSNYNNYSIRLSLFHYFGYTNKDGINQEAYDKIMNRFGFTVLDYLFSMLFKKKSEAVSLKFLLENIPYVLKAEPNSQRMFHQTLKFYLLKKPERFLLFLSILTDKLAEDNKYVPQESQKTFLQHLGALFKVAADISHKDISLEIFSDITRIHHPFKDEIIKKIYADVQIKNEIKTFITQKKNEQFRLHPDHTDEFIPNTHHDPLSAHKRGRKPHLSVVEKEMGVLEQISELSQVSLAS